MTEETLIEIRRSVKAELCMQMKDLERRNLKESDTYRYLKARLDSIEAKEQSKQ